MNYIGVNMVKATKMNLDTASAKGYEIYSKAEYNGYEVEYSNGEPTRWIKESDFDKFYRSTDGMTFGLAVEAMKMGKKVARKGWNGSNMFAVLSPGKEKLEADKFFNLHLRDYANLIGGVMDVRPSFMLKTAQDDVAYWAPSGSDCLAEDWIVLE